MASVSPLDPEDDETTTAAPGDNSSSDASTGKFQKAWEAWQSRPENNAALLQFGISMLQPHAAGQSGIGAAANAIGEAGQAANRSITSQNLEADRASAEEDKATGRANQGKTADAALINANAYKSLVNGKSATGSSGEAKIQGDFRKWLAKPDDPFTGDPVVAAIGKDPRFADIKTKGDLLNNKAAIAAAYALFRNQLADPEDVSAANAPPAASAPPAAAPQTRTIYKGGKPYSWDGVNPPVPIHPDT